MINDVYIRISVTSSAREDLLLALGEGPEGLSSEKIRDCIAALVGPKFTMMVQAFIS